MPPHILCIGCYSNQFNILHFQSLFLLRDSWLRVQFTHALCCSHQNPRRLHARNTAALSFKTMFLHSFFFVYVLLVLGLAVGTDATVPCNPDTYKHDVTYTSIASVTSLVRSFYPFDGGKQEVTFTKTNIVWETTTTTLHHKHYAPPVVRTSPIHIVSTAQVTITHTIQVLCPLVYLFINFFCLSPYITS